MPDNRRVKITFAKPTRLKIEHNGTVYYDEELPAGDHEIKFAGIVPYETGTSTVFINDKPISSITLK
ncbi:MAG TPA: hypothetical protein V6C81_12360 [Planktothrix sp.]|jgi:hypothetical protein